MVKSQDKKEAPDDLCRVPEYDAAGRQFVVKLIDDLMYKQVPVLAEIKRVPVDHMPTEASAPGSAVGMSAGPAEIVTTVCDGVDTVMNMDLDAFASMIHDAAKQALDSYMPQFSKQMRTIADAAGQTVDARGRPFSVDLYLDMLEKLEIKFRPDGKPIIPSLVTSPDNATKAQAVLDAQWTPTQLQRQDRILDQKRKDFDARRRVRVLG